MTPTPIYQDHTGQWREKNPYDMYDYIQDDDVVSSNPSYDLFEQSITYHPFPNEPNVKQGEVVMARLQIKHTKGWSNLREDEINTYKNSNAELRWVAANQSKRNSMNIYAKPGDKVIVTEESANQGGYAHHKEAVAKHLKIGGVYEVDHTDVRDWHTDVYLKGFDNIAFNSVCLEDYPLPANQEGKEEQASPIEELADAVIACRDREASVPKVESAELYEAAYHYASITANNAGDEIAFIAGANWATSSLQSLLEDKEKEVVELRELVSKLAEYCPIYEEDYWAEIRNALNKKA